MGGGLAADRLTPCSSREMLAFLLPPRFVGMNIGVDVGGAGEFDVGLDSGTGFDAALVAGSSASSAFTAGADGRVWNTKPFPWPPPSTLSGAGGFGFFSFGAGSMDSSADRPPAAPGARRGFFAGGFSLSRSSSSSAEGFRDGSPILTFLAPVRVCEVFGGGRESFEAEEDAWGAVDLAGCATCVVSLSLSLSLPLP